MRMSYVVRRFVDEIIRRRGERYFSAGNVRIIAGTDWNVFSSVSGSAEKPYRVSLKANAARLNDLTAHCTCPYFDEVGLCKHIWATLLAAEQQGLLGAISGRNDLQLVGDDATESAGSLSSQMLYGDLDTDADPYPDEFDDSEEDLPVWRQIIEDIHREEDASQRGARQTKRGTTGPNSEIIYLVEPDIGAQADEFLLHVFTRHKKRGGQWSMPRRCRIDEDDLETRDNPQDKSILALLLGAGTRRYGGFYSNQFNGLAAVRPEALEVLVPLLCETGRFFVGDIEDTDSLVRLTLDANDPWEFRLRIGANRDGDQWLLDGFLVRDDTTILLDAPTLITRNGWFIVDDRIGRIRNPESLLWVEGLLETDDGVEVPQGEETELLKQLCKMRSLPPIDFPDIFGVQRISVPMRPELHVSRPDNPQRDSRRLELVALFVYDDHSVRPDPAAPPLLLIENERKLLERDNAAEAVALATLTELGCRPGNLRGEWEPTQPGEFTIATGKLARLVRELVTKGWRVKADGKLYRSAGNTQLRVRSGIDWFDLEGHVQYGDETVGLPKLLKALRSGENHVVLDDGSIGLLPETWLSGLGLLQAAGTVHDEAIRFKTSQACLLDALLLNQQDRVATSWDETFDHAQSELRQFDQVKPLVPEPSFQGTLRPYQQEGLGWTDFLRRFGFGGCLADDMGLGKTIQALALLDRQRVRAEVAGKENGVSLVVAPKSVVDNWQAETARFTPRLRVLVHVGSERSTDAKDLKAYDLVLTTYGILRKDAAWLRKVPFHYVILDEAQAIKNASSQTAKAARLLQADYRLALSGTPIENHVGELWSLFEFLNPGMLGGHGLFASLTKVQGDSVDDDSLKVITQALRPLILRRTKEQVTADLPPKTEQTLYCELDETQQRLYHETREHFRRNLLEGLDDTSLGSSKIHVLEALLRLRQIACHPALVDPDVGEDVTSSKIELLFEMLQQVLSEGHKALVFSQFTTLLSIVRDRLDKQQIPYAYLDGKTRKRAQVVERFQTDDTCPVFLISLKAGGLGLNLTAADYVFLLDPWWNPAVEAQAIDRAHRIGQEQHVFAYRLIAKNTVEEKVLALQAQKRDLAEAIIGGAPNLLRTLTRQDLDLLLS